jgi:rhodanese-related sulfurtransferase
VVVDRLRGTFSRRQSARARPGCAWPLKTTMLFMGEGIILDAQRPVRCDSERLDQVRTAGRESTTGERQHYGTRASSDSSAVCAWSEGTAQERTAIELVDVRTEEERAIATIDGSRVFDQAYHDALLLRDRDTPHRIPVPHGVRSQRAAEYFRREGFRNLYNLRGGIDAWSLLVDTSVPRY